VFAQSQSSAERGWTRLYEGHPRQDAFRRAAALFSRAVSLPVNGGRGSVSPRGFAACHSFRNNRQSRYHIRQGGPAVLAATQRDRSRREHPLSGRSMILDASDSRSPSQAPGNRVSKGHVHPRFAPFVAIPFARMFAAGAISSSSFFQFFFDTIRNEGDRWMAFLGVLLGGRGQQQTSRCPFHQ
jgi:hypothetical protein